MRALAMKGFGGLEQIETVEVSPPTVRAPDDVRVRIHAAALNRIDLFVLRGLPKAQYAFPHVLGSDGAGVVEGLDRP